MSRAAPAVVATLLGLVALATFKSSPGVPGKSAAALPGKRSGAVAAAPHRSTHDHHRRATGDPGLHARHQPRYQSSRDERQRDAHDRRRPVRQPIRHRSGPGDAQGHQILDVTPLQMPTDRQRSAEISQQAEPLLQQEVLQAQSAQIDIVGGASYTSQSYAQSLQSALDRAGD